MLFYLGRQDRQVQIRGYRVELGDIESLLKQHPDIADAWVDVRRNAAATPLLVAFYCSVNGVALDAQQLRVWLSLRLPLHMLPLLYVPLSAMPLGVNGKIDPSACRWSICGSWKGRASMSSGNRTGTASGGDLAAVAWPGACRHHHKFLRSGGHSPASTDAAIHRAAVRSARGVG